MDKIWIGYIKEPKGLKGELKLKSSFERILDAIRVGNTIYFNDEKHTITDSKPYKDYYLINIDNLNDINLIEKYKGYDVYTTREILGMSDKDYLMKDLIGMDIVCNDKTYGKVSEVVSNNQYYILKIDYKTKYMIPFVDSYIIDVNTKDKKITCQNVEGLIL